MQKKHERRPKPEDLSPSVAERNKQNHFGNREYIRPLDSCPPDTEEQRSLKAKLVILLMIEILHYLKGPKLWELWYIPYSWVMQD